MDPCLRILIGFLHSARCNEAGPPTRYLRSLLRGPRSVRDCASRNEFSGKSQAGGPLPRASDRASFRSIFFASRILRLSVKQVRTFARNAFWVIGALFQIPTMAWQCLLACSE